MENTKNTNKKQIQIKSLEGFKEAIKEAYEFNYEFGGPRAEADAAVTLEVLKELLEAAGYEVSEDDEGRLYVITSEGDEIVYKIGRDDSGYWNEFVVVNEGEGPYEIAPRLAEATESVLEFSAKELTEVWEAALDEFRGPLSFTYDGNGFKENLKSFKEFTEKYLGTAYRGRGAFYITDAIEFLKKLGFEFKGVIWEDYIDRAGRIRDYTIKPSGELYSARLYINTEDKAVWLEIN